MHAAFASLRLIPGEYDALVSLRDWLTDDEALRGRVLLERLRTADGELSTVPGVLMVALGMGGVVTALARSVPLWLRRHADMFVELRDPDGRTVVVSAKGTADTQAAIQSLLHPGSGDRGAVPPA